MDFSEDDEALVKQSWQILRQNISEYSTLFFTKILEIAPETKNMFSFLRDLDELPRNSPRLRLHAVKVLKLTCESAMRLREKGEVAVPQSTLRYVGSIHLKREVLDPHFEVLKEALLKTVEEAVGEKWSEEMKCAWAKAYDHLAVAIKDEMKLQASSSDEL